MNWFAPGVCPVTPSNPETTTPQAYNLTLTPRCPVRQASLSVPLSLPALPSILMDITLLFLGLCTQSVLTWGKVSHQYVPQLHNSQPPNWWDNKHNSTVKLSLSESILSRGWKLFAVIYDWLFTGFPKSHSCKASIKWEFSASDQQKLGSHILATRGWDKDNKKLGENWFFHTEEHTQSRTHTLLDL